MLGLPHLGDAFGAFVVKEGVDSVVLQVRLVLNCEESVVYIPLLLRETGVSFQAFVREDSFEVLICVHFFVVLALS